MSDESSAGHEGTVGHSRFDEDERERIRRFATLSRSDRRPDLLLPNTDDGERADGASPADDVSRAEDVSHVGDGGRLDDGGRRGRGS
ncbi:hypothetical protein ACFO0N_13055 [Halobium salinum]|uniref:Uncharacterized protein n=1 Tax=Halobium salinum TaxID=1364940 RepID=A0ABD5PD85_9EURY|nr:hypothetical protein [Halobium salinum]